jgi:UDP-N-acetylglucosamine acyltransferase
VEDYAIIGGMTAVHQFVRIGCHAMVGGMSRVTHDVPPYTIGGGVPYLLGGINRIGLKRRQFSFETRMALFKAYRCLYRSNLSLQSALEQIESQLPQTEEIRHFLNFCRTTQRGLIGMGVQPESAEDKEEKQHQENEYAAQGLACTTAKQ